MFSQIFFLLILEGLARENILCAAVIFHFYFHKKKVFLLKQRSLLCTHTNMCLVSKRFATTPTAYMCQAVCCSAVIHPLPTPSSNTRAPADYSHSWMSLCSPVHFLIVKIEQILELLSCRFWYVRTNFVYVAWLFFVATLRALATVQVCLWQTWTADEQLSVVMFTITSTSSQARVEGGHSHSVGVFLHGDMHLKLAPSSSEFL